MQLFTKTTSSKISGRKHPSFSSILSLFFASSPKTIVRFIVTIIINTFQRMINWTWPHIRIKVFEGLQPLTTNFNSTSAIPPICPIMWIYAALFHICPHMIFRFIGQIRTWAFGFTTTGLRRTILQRNTFDYFNCSAIAFTFESYPTSGMNDIRGTFNYDKFSESLSNSIYKFHKCNYNIIPIICQEVIV